MSNRIVDEQGTKRVTVVVADDHPLYREGVVRALLASGRMEIVAEAEDGERPWRRSRSTSPTSPCSTTSSPNSTGWRSRTQWSASSFETRVLLVSAFIDSGVVYRALETGAAGFVSKEARREQIADAVLACARGGTSSRPTSRPGWCRRSGSARPATLPP